MIRERGKVNGRAATGRRGEIHRQLWCARLRLTGAGGAEPWKETLPRLDCKRAASSAVVPTMANQQITRLLQRRRDTEPFRRAYRGTERGAATVVMRHQRRSPSLFAQSTSDQPDKSHRPWAAHSDEPVAQECSRSIAR